MESGEFLGGYSRPPKEVLQNFLGGQLPLAGGVKPPDSPSNTALVPPAL